MSNLTILDRRWKEHLDECSSCTEWFESGGRQGGRCINGWAISTVFEDELEMAMPAEEAASRGESL